MIQKITHQGDVLATIIRAEYQSDGIEFFTSDELPQQLGYMRREKGYIIKPHKHPVIERKISQTFETLILRSGKVKVWLYDSSDTLIEECIISTGDIILLSGCGHGFEMLEDSEIIEIKQGPYISECDKVNISGSKVST